MWVVILVHALAAGAMIVASVLAIRFLVVLPLWLGVLVGLLLYLLTILLAKLDDDEEGLSGR